MKETFERLRRLQELDTELKTLSAKATEIPRQVENLKQAAARARTELEQTRQAITDHKKSYKLAEVDLKSADEKIATYSVQLYSAKTNEQYKAFLKEIETQKKLKSEIEDRMIVLMEEAEALAQKRESADKQVSRLDEETGRKVKVLENDAKEIETAAAERERARAELAQVLPQNALKLYERIRKNKAGLAVVTTRNERCNGCLNPVPAQRLLEVKRQNRLYTCEACGRILVPEEESKTRSGQD